MGIRYKQTEPSWDLSGVTSVGIGNLAMKDRSR